MESELKHVSWPQTNDVPKHALFAGHGGHCSIARRITRLWEVLGNPLEGRESLSPMVALPHGTDLNMGG